MKRDPCLSLCTKLKSKWIKDLDVKPYTLNLIEDDVGKSLELIDMNWGIPKHNSKSSDSKIKS